MTYRVTTDDCNKPERGCLSCTLGNTDNTLTITHKIKLKEMKNLFSAQSSGCNTKIIAVINYISNLMIIKNKVKK